MNKAREIFNFKQPEKEQIAMVGVLYVTVFGLMLITGLTDQSENRLTEVKEKLLNQATPKSSEICTGFFDTGCYRQGESEYCDGQNTALNFKDDVCENISYWQYSPTFEESIK